MEYVLVLAGWFPQITCRRHRLFTDDLFYSYKLAHVQVVINCRYFVAQSCSREDMLAHNIGALYFDDVMSYNSLTTLYNCPYLTGSGTTFLGVLMLVKKWFVCSWSPLNIKKTNKKAETLEPEPVLRTSGASCTHIILPHLSKTLSLSYHWSWLCKIWYSRHFFHFCIH